MPKPKKSTTSKKVASKKNTTTTTPNFAQKITAQLKEAILSVKKDLEKSLKECLTLQERSSRKKSSAVKKLDGAMTRKSQFTDKVKERKTEAAKNQLERAKLAVLSAQAEIKAQDETTKLAKQQEKAMSNEFKKVEKIEQSVLKLSLPASSVATAKPSSNKTAVKKEKLPVTEKDQATEATTENS